MQEPDLPDLAGGCIPPTAPGGRPVAWAATGRWGGSSLPPYDSLNLARHVGDDPDSVVANRARVAMSLACRLAESGPPESRLTASEPPALAVLDAAHGSAVDVVDAAGDYAGVDALVTRTPGLAVVALGADCVPIGIVAEDGITIAAAHCGWRGLAADVLGAAVAAIRLHGTDVRTVILGPSVCGACYPVPTERAAEIGRRTSADVAAAALVRTSDGQPGIDVRDGLVVRLSELGVPRGSVIIAGGCTVEDRSLFSHRRDGITGRHGLAVGTMGTGSPASGGREGRR